MEMKDIKTRVQLRRLKRDAQIKELWSELYIEGSNTKVVVGEQIAERLDVSLTTVLRIAQPKTD